MEPDQLWKTGWVQSLGQKANIVVPEVGHTCTAGRGRVIDFAVISHSVQPFWRGITAENNSPCKPQFTATPTQVRVRQACFPKNFAFPKTVEQVVPSRNRMKSKKPSLRNPTRKRSSLSQQERDQVCLQGRALGVSHATPTQDTNWSSECGFSVNWVLCNKNTSLCIGATFSGIHADSGGVRCGGARSP